MICCQAGMSQELCQTTNHSGVISKLPRDRDQSLNRLIINIKESKNIVPGIMS